MLPRRQSALIVPHYAHIQKTLQKPNVTCHTPNMVDQNITLKNNLVASLPSILNSAGMPNHLWGTYLLTIHDVPTFVDVGLSISLKEKLLNRA